MKRELDLLCGPDTLKPNVIVGVFLVREGANIHALNKQGLHPLSVRPPDVAQLVNSYAAIHTKSVIQPHTVEHQIFEVHYFHGLVTSDVSWKQLSQIKGLL